MGFRNLKYEMLNALGFLKRPASTSGRRGLSCILSLCGWRWRLALVLPIPPQSAEVTDESHAQEQALPLT